ncbi:MAG TPA: allophanate hydrolase [Stellaceae bacterium]|jgi:allophanate hydrolase|nr:allophanate hydrolase [Stellaceae bacterium]
MSAPIASLDIATLRRQYQAGTHDPVDVAELVLKRIAERGDDKVWIHRLPADAIVAMARQLAAAGPAGKPLYGIPFAIKDNIDLAGHPTTAGCPDFSYVPAESAPVVAALIAAGAMPIGKTNLDQFATGLVGTRSPYGAPANSFDPAYVSGGSSSGSAVAVAAGLVSFALGTDTAGSGRVPASFNNLIGVKPSCGLLSTRGVVPACRSLDCVSIFALTAEDAGELLAVAQGFDPLDPFSRDAALHAAATIPRDFADCRVGVPRVADLAFFGNDDGKRLFDEAVVLVQRLGARVTEIDFTPFLETARLLYEGPWVAERYAAIRDFIERQPGSLYPVTRRIIEGGGKPRAVDAFTAYYRLKALRRVTEPYWRDIDVMITPTAPRCYTIAEVLADPIQLNSNLGYYTNFMNLLDLSAVAVPAGFQRDGLPFGVTLAAPAFQDGSLLALGRTMQHEQNLPMGALGHPLPASVDHRAARDEPGIVRVAVLGAHMTGLPLNHELIERGGRFVRRDRTAPLYRLFALAGVSPAKPGLVRAEPGRAIELEIWQMPVANYGAFVAGVPGPLAIGSIALATGERVQGFVCEAYATAGAEDISELGGWRRYLEVARVE